MMLKYHGLKLTHHAQIKPLTKPTQYNKEFEQRKNLFISYES
jgi:hypothetical protein